MIETILLPLLAAGAAYWLGYRNGNTEGLNEGYYNAMGWWASKLHAASDKDTGKVEIEFYFVKSEEE